VSAVFLSWLFIYLWTFFIIQTRDTFKVSIPYLDFKRQGRSLKPWVLDASVLIDGRIVSLVETGLLTAPLVLPRFVLSDLQVLARSEEKILRVRGQQGLEQLKKLREKTELRIDESFQETSMKDDQRFLHLLQQLDACLLTTDESLCQALSLQETDAINLNKVAAAFRPMHPPGEILQVDLVKEGELEHQAVGYLADGSMVVVEDAVDKIGQNIRVQVSKNLQTHAGQMIFGKCHD
jgi:uncharacterized protein YacL